MNRWHASSSIQARGSQRVHQLLKRHCRNCLFTGSAGLQIIESNYGTSGHSIVKLCCRKVAFVLDHTSVANNCRIFHYPLGLDLAFE